MPERRGIAREYGRGLIDADRLVAEATRERRANASDPIGRGAGIIDWEGKA